MNKLLTEKIKCELTQNINVSGAVLKGYVKATNALRLAIIHDTSAQTYALYVTILAHRNALTGQCFPSREVLSREMNWSSSYIDKNLALLKKKGYIEIKSGMTHQSNCYYFPYEDFAEPENNINSANNSNNTNNNVQNKLSSRNFVKNNEIKTGSTIKTVSSKIKRRKDEDKIKPMDEAEDIEF